MAEVHGGTVHDTKVILRALAAFFLSALVGTAFAGNRYQASLESAYDGDTVTVWVSVQDDLKRRYKLRVVGIDTPEIRTAKCPKEREMAYQARDFVVNLLIARTFDVELTGKMTFSRHLAHVYVDGVNLADLIISAGLGRRNFGERRSGWCES